MMQKVFNFRGLLLAGVFLFGNLWALACTAKTPEAAAQEWLQQQNSSQTFLQNESTSQENNSAGYVVQRTLTDSALGVQWVLVGDCAHPAWPMIAVVLPKGKLRRGSNSQPVQTALRPAEIPDYAPAQVRLVTTQTMPESDIPFQTVNVKPENATFAHLASATMMLPHNTPDPVLVRAGDRVVLWNHEPQLQMAIEATALEYGRAGQVIHLRRGGTSSSWNATMTGVVRGPNSVELMP